MDSADLQRTAVELTKDWYPTLSPFTQQADQEHEEAVKPSPKK